jgi:hypothetical protein
MVELHPCSKCDKDLERRYFSNNYKGEPHTVCKICWVIHSARLDIRTCTKCYNKLELHDFSINSKGEPCKGCKTCNKKRNDLAKLPKYKETVKRYYDANRERLNETKRLYCQANKEKINETKRVYAQANKEHINELSRLNYQANKEHICEKHKQWRDDNPDKLNVKVVCEICCSTISRHNRAKHEKTQKCQNALKLKLNAPLCEFYSL